MNAPETMPETTDRLALTVKGLEPASALALREAFAPFLAQASEWTDKARAIVITSADDKKGMQDARESRLGLKKVRVNAEKTKDRLKKDALAYGRAVDAAFKLVKDTVEPLEEHLEAQEKFAERVAAEQRAQVRAAREEALRALGTDPAAYADLGAMTEEVWSAALDSAKAAQAAREEAARQAEAARIEAERLAAERVEAERVAREKAEADAKAQREAAEKARREAEAVRAQAERERREREEAEQKRREDEAAERERIANASDAEKLGALARALRAVELPECSGEVGRDVVARVVRMVEWVERQARAVAS